MNKNETITVRLDPNSVADAAEAIYWRAVFWRCIRVIAMFVGVVLLGVAGYYSGAFTDGSKLNQWTEQHDRAKKEAIYGNSKTVEQTNQDQQNEMLCRNGSPYCQK